MTALATGHELQAELYDVINDAARGKDYAHEAKLLAGIIRGALGRGQHTVLDLGCGTARHHEYFPSKLKLTGLDLSDAQLRVARERAPKTVFYKYDMFDFHLPEQFDAAMLLFSSIYMTTVEELNNAIALWAEHLRTGGVLILEAWIAPHEFKGAIGTDSAKTPDVHVTRMISATRSGPNAAFMEMEFLVGRPGLGMTRFTETMTLGMFDQDQYLAAFHAAGLEAEIHPKGLAPNRDLYVARKV